MKYRATCAFNAEHRVPSIRLDVSAPNAVFAKKLARAICISEGLPNPKTVKASVVK